MSEARRIRVLLVDDQLLFVESLRCVLSERTDDIEVVGVANDGEEAVDMAGRDRPDIILLDVRMPKQDGVVTARRIHELYPAIKVIMLTTFQDDKYVKEALRWGAIGYLLKSIPPDELIKSIRAVSRSITQISPEIMVKLVRDAGVPERHMGGAESLEEILTKRELEILSLLIRAYDNRSIADKLCISEGTAKNHIHNIYDKFAVSNRYQLIRHLKENYIDLDL
jgi:DNA-binding NarL/FixJ family response regulator